MASERFKTDQEYAIKAIYRLNRMTNRKKYCWGILYCMATGMDATLAEAEQEGGICATEMEPSASCYCGDRMGVEVLQALGIEQDDPQ